MATPILFEPDLKPLVTCGVSRATFPPLSPGDTVCEYDRLPVTDYQRLMRAGATKLFNHQASRHREETMNYYRLVPPGGNASISLAYAMGSKVYNVGHSMVLLALLLLNPLTSSIQQ